MTCIAHCNRILPRHLEAGDVMPGTGGFHKLRWAEAGRGKESAAAFA